VKDWNVVTPVICSGGANTPCTPGVGSSQAFRIRGMGFATMLVHGITLCEGVHRGIANLDTKEMSSLSVEPANEDDEIVVSLFEVSLTPEAVVAWIDREHEFRFVAVQPLTMQGAAEPHFAVRTLTLCCGSTCEAFQAMFRRM
jgi:hypothetical protein